MKRVSFMYLSILMALAVVTFQSGLSLGQRRPQRLPQLQGDPGLPNAHPYSGRLGRNPRGEYALAWFPRARQPPAGFTGRATAVGAGDTEARSGGYKKYQGSSLGIGGRSAISTAATTPKPAAGSHGNFGERRR